MTVEPEVEALSLLVVAGTSVKTCEIDSHAPSALVGELPGELSLVPLEPGVAPLARLVPGRPLTLFCGTAQPMAGEQAVPEGGLALHPGDTFTIGETLFTVRPRRLRFTRRIWTHGSFEVRLEEQCIRAERYGEEFSLVHLRLPLAVPAADAELVLSNTLRLTDVLAAYGPNEYEVILTETTQEEASIATQRLRAQLEPLGTPLHIGRARFPADGVSPDALTAIAYEGSRGERGAPAAQMPLGAAMQQLHSVVERVATSSLSVLVLGETGAGKERVAEMVHTLSPRAKGPFLRLNCAALTEALLESELFGHEKGSFTGADRAKPGLLETCDGGTVFLDEVGELPLGTQAKLLRVIEERQVLRVGGLKSRGIDVRFVAATNRDVEAEVRRGRFREDLFFRINGVTLWVPPLRERMSELEGLVRFFIEDTCRREVRAPVPAVSGEAMAFLRRYQWPGNVRELKNVIERAVILCQGESIEVRHLPVEKMTASLAPRQAAPRRPGDGGRLSDTAAGHSTRSRELNLTPRPDRTTPVNASRVKATGEPETPSGLDPRASADDWHKAFAALELKRIRWALEQCGGNQTDAAALIGMPRRTFLNRLTEYGIARPRKRKR